MNIVIFLFCIGIQAIRIASGDSFQDAARTENPEKIIPSLVHIIKIDKKPITHWMFLNYLSILHNIRPSKLIFHHVGQQPHSILMVS